ncbi:hypothetical protein B5X24_HaOG215518 [Helicoverpa armigera]|nr:hypothetical protein B5X24_HaOG215518 [Helicoverpa armigera]
MIIFLYFSLDKLRTTIFRHFDTFSLFVRNMGKPVKRRNRRILGCRPYKNYSEEMLHLAVENVKENRISSRSAEKKIGIPRRTILNKVKEYHNKNVGTPTRLSLEEEKSIVQALIAAGEYGCPLTKLDLRLTVFDYLKKNIVKIYLMENHLARTGLQVFSTDMQMNFLLEARKISKQRGLRKVQTIF